MDCVLQDGQEPMPPPQKPPKSLDSSTARKKKLNRERSDGRAGSPSHTLDSSGDNAGSSTSSSPLTIPVHTVHTMARSESDTMSLNARNIGATTPRKSQSTNCVADNKIEITRSIDNDDDEQLDSNANARMSFKKRASQVLTGVGAMLTKRKSKKNLAPVEDPSQIPPPPPLPAWFAAKKPKKRKLKKKKNTRAAIVADLLKLETELGDLRTEIELIIKALEQETGCKMTDSRLVIKESPEERILEKMLENPYQSLFKLSGGKVVNESIALAPPRPLLYKTLLIPNVNLNYLSEEDKQKLFTLDFDALELKDSNDEHKAYLLLMQMFHHLDLPRIFKISDLTLYRFIATIARRYRDVPFHNFFHAFNVTQTAFYFLTTGQAKQLLGPLEQFAALVATICHDCDHPGLNNDFQHKAQTRIAHLHRKSCLENHHYLQCMAVLSKPESNLLMNLNQQDEDLMYIYLRDLILATDLAIHGVILKNLTERKKILHRAWRAGKPSELSDEDRKLIMCSLVKCSDLSNEIRKQHMAKKWAQMVLAEFFAQSDKEREMGLPVTPFMDKHKIIIAKEQINFIEKLCIPLYTQISAVFPALESCCRQLEENRDNWQQRLNSFFTNPEEIKRLSNRSLWERPQEKPKDTVPVSKLIAMRASDASVPKPRKQSISLSTPPLIVQQIVAASSNSAPASPAGKK